MKINAAIRKKARLFNKLNQISMAGFSFHCHRFDVWMAQIEFPEL